MNALQLKFWVKRIKKWLKKGHVDKVLEALSALDDSKDTDEDIRKTIGYCKTHYHRMQYADFIAQNLPIGSGVIESAIRRIVNLRIKGPGIFWLPENAERVAHQAVKLKLGIGLIL